MTARIRAAASKVFLFVVLSCGDGNTCSTCPRELDLVAGTWHGRADLRIHAVDNIHGGLDEGTVEVACVEWRITIERHGDSLAGTWVAYAIPDACYGATGALVGRLTSDSTFVGTMGIAGGSNPLAVMLPIGEDCVLLSSDSSVAAVAYSLPRAGELHVAGPSRHRRCQQPPNYVWGPITTDYWDELLVVADR